MTAPTNNNVRIVSPGTSVDVKNRKYREAIATAKPTKIKTKRISLNNIGFLEGPNSAFSLNGRPQLTQNWAMASLRNWQRGQV